VGQFGQQQPAQWMSGQADECRGSLTRRAHALEYYIKSV
jgi:hypothetical protein